ncbi:unnamed protein product, partial [marine sediment metagenome]
MPSLEENRAIVSNSMTPETILVVWTTGVRDSKG